LNIEKNPIEELGIKKEHYKMTVTEVYIPKDEARKPWVETPLKESYALSQAAGWYGHTPSLFSIKCAFCDFSIQLVIFLGISTSKS
jgi:hypothetical protein